MFPTIRKLVIAALAVAFVGVSIQNFYELSERPHTMPRTTCENLLERAAYWREMPTEHDKLRLKSVSYQTLRMGCWDGKNWSHEEIKAAHPHVLEGIFKL